MQKDHQLLLVIEVEVEVDLPRVWWNSYLEGEISICLIFETQSREACLFWCKTEPNTS